MEPIKIPDNMHLCKTCNLIQSNEMFDLNKKNKPFRRCKKCTKIKNKEHYTKNRDKLIVVMKDYYNKKKAENPEKIKERSRQYHLKHLEKKKLLVAKEMTLENIAK